jgi:putative transcriptional regulator
MDKNPIPKLQDGSLLLSAHFVRSVILLCEHQAMGSFGFVINKPSILHLGDLVKELQFLDADVFVGGPVEQNTLHFIYYGAQVIPESRLLGEGIWWGG